jgi:23S rRNA (adenine2503-C2)-methyltransferase
MTERILDLRDISRESNGGLIDFFDLSRDDIEKMITENFGESKYRSRQIFDWVYRKQVTDIALMTDISKSLREKLAATVIFANPVIRERQISLDGTRKYLFEVDNGDLVESVMIKQPNRMTLCVSSQVGCGMACKFCRTGTMGLRRNLRASEIMQQVMGVLEDAKNFGDTFQNMVFMGMGEPLHNFKGVTTALRLLRDPLGINLSGRKITVSSVGLVPAIEKFAQSGIDTNLAISLNATTDEVRDQIMPINKAFPIQKLLETLRAFPLKPRRKITIEYVMLGGINDTDADLKRLPQLLRGIPSKVNLIPYNENAGLGFTPPTRDTLQRWQDALMKSGFDTTIRWSKGRDIQAACGQLATASVKIKKKSADVPVSPEAVSSLT